MDQIVKDNCGAELPFFSGIGSAILEDHAGNRCRSIVLGRNVKNHFPFGSRKHLTFVSEFLDLSLGNTFLGG